MRYEDLRSHETRFVATKRSQLSADERDTVASTDRHIIDAFMAPTGEPHAVRKSERFIPLEEAERRQLRELVSDPFLAPAGQLVHETGDPVDSLLIVVSGMLAQVATDAEGRTQSSRFFLPGDAVSGHEIALRHRATDVIALTDCRLAALPRATFMGAADTRMWRMFYLFRQVEQAIATDRVRILGRARAEERLLHVLLELHARQRLCVPEIGDRVWLPMNQTEIADATGLTNVYVSKTMGRLRDRGIVSATGRSSTTNVIGLHNPAALSRSIDHVDRYADLDATRALNAPAGGLVAQ